MLDSFEAVQKTQQEMTTEARIGGDNNHINAEGQIMLGKITASAVEEFYRAKE